MVWWYIAVFIVALVAGFALAAPKPQTTPPAGINEFNVPTAQEGREIPVLFGTRDIEAPNIVWYGDLATVAIKSSGGKK